MAEWINLYNASRISGFSAGWICKLIKRGSVPADQVRRSGNQWQITTNAAKRLQQLKEGNADWTNKEIPEPPDAVHAPDPLGLYPGFMLPPDAARRLATIRILHRLYPTTQERNEAIRGDG